MSHNLDEILDDTVTPQWNHLPSPLQRKKETTKKKENTETAVKKSLPIGLKAYQHSQRVNDKW